MSVSYGIKLSGITVRVAILALCGLIATPGISVGQPATDAQVEGAADESDLRWKPHRFATATPRGEDVTPNSAANAAATDAVATTPRPQDWATPGTTTAEADLPPASVSLPDRVPAATPLAIRPRAPETAPYAPLRGSLARGMQEMGDWIVSNSGAAQRQAATSPNGSFAERMMRTPQGQSGRPILERDTGFGISDSRPATALGGGLAPRYSPAAASRSGSDQTRPGERIAMNVDGIPSVMTRAPQAAAIDARPPSRPSTNAAASDALPPPRAEAIDPPIVIETTPMGMDFDGGMEMPMDGAAGDGMWMGQYPAELHVESFYDDPYACDEEGGVLPLHVCDGRLCRWMRRFGKPYYGWKWYRDFTASVGVTSFQNESNLGLNGNYGTNEYLNWAMPFWNAFGIGWQVGVRGVQTNFQRTTITDTSTGNSFRTNARDQVFLTTGFFTRAFEGRGLQGGAVYDYLHDSYFDNVDVSQIRAEASYVWGYHELGFWGAFNIGEQASIFAPVTKIPGEASTENLYTAFYRLQFGDANEWRVWGGATATQAGIVGSSMRAPMSKSWALEGTFTYLIPGRTENFGTLIDGLPVTVSSSPSAWNVSLNVVYYPARRSRRSLASPYRPLFDVADNGSMIRTIDR